MIIITIRTDLLYNSIEDLEGTIRAVDSKISYLLVVLFLPVTQFSLVRSGIRSIFARSLATEIVSLSLAALAAMLWAASAYFSARALMPADAPDVLGDEHETMSCFYPRHLFNLSARVVVLGGGKCERALSDHVDSLPEEEDQLVRALSCEQIKLMYIASLKSMRSRLAYLTLIAWGAASGALWLALEVAP